MENKQNQRVCPWWMGYAFILPFRKYKHDPDKILVPYLKKGMMVMDFGCAMGYFSIPMAKYTGPDGKVFCVDIQKKMLDKLQQRAVKYGVSSIIEPLLISENYRPDTLENKLDFVLLFAVVHEVPDQMGLFRDIYRMLKSGGKVLFAEPKGHVSQQDFDQSIKLAVLAGLKILSEKPLKKGLNIMFVKK